MDPCPVGPLEAKFAQDLISALRISDAEHVASLARSVDRKALQSYRHGPKALPLLHVAAWRACKTDRVSRLKGSCTELDVIQDVCRILLDEFGLDVHATDERGCTVLFLSSALGNVGLSKLLLERRAAVDHMNNADETALFAAARYGEHRCIRHLLESRADPSRQNRHGQTALMVSGERAWMTTSRDGKLVKDVQWKTMMRLRAAMKCRPGHDDMKEASRVDQFGRNALFYSHSYECTKWLIAKRCKINKKDNQHRTPLHWAASMGPCKKVEELLQARADPNAMDMHGQTPLFLALDARNFRTCYLLLDASCDPHLEDKAQVTVANEVHNRVSRAIDKKERMKAKQLAELIGGEPKLVFARAEAVRFRRKTAPRLSRKSSPPRRQKKDKVMTELQKKDTVVTERQKKDRSVTGRQKKDKLVTEADVSIPVSPPPLRSELKAKRDAKMMQLHKEGDAKRTRSQKEGRAQKQRATPTKKGVEPPPLEDPLDLLEKTDDKSGPLVRNVVLPPELHGILEQPQVWEDMGIGSLNLTADEAALFKHAFSQNVRMQPNAQAARAKRLPVIDDKFKSQLQDKLDMLDDDALDPIMEFLGSSVSQTPMEEAAGDADEEQSVDLEKLPPQKLQRMLEMVEKALADIGKSSSTDMSELDARCTYTISFTSGGRRGAALRQGDSGYEAAVREQFTNLRQILGLDRVNWPAWVKDEPSQ